MLCLVLATACRRAVSLKCVSIRLHLQLDFRFLALASSKPGTGITRQHPWTLVSDETALKIDAVISDHYRLLIIAVDFERAGRVFTNKTALCRKMRPSLIVRVSRYDEDA